MSKEIKRRRGTFSYLGIDWGKSDVGLALADEETKMAFAYKTLKNDRDFLRNLAKIIAEKNVKEVVIGIPSYINRERVEYEGETLGRIIEAKLSARVHYQNEMFTTKMAQANLIEKGVKKIKRYDDQEAARIILQDWLDKCHSRPPIRRINSGGLPAGK